MNNNLGTTHYLCVGEVGGIFWFSTKEKTWPTPLSPFVNSWPSPVKLYIIGDPPGSTAAKPDVFYLGRGQTTTLGTRCPTLLRIGLWDWTSSLQTMTHPQSLWNSLLTHTFSPKKNRPGPPHYSPPPPHINNNRSLITRWNHKALSMKPINHSTCTCTDVADILIKVYTATTERQWRRQKDRIWLVEWGKISVLVRTHFRTITCNPLQNNSLKLSYCHYVFPSKAKENWCH